jgi:site-specific recombinase XerD
VVRKKAAPGVFNWWTAMQNTKTEVPVRSHVKDNHVLAAKFSQWISIQNYSANTRRTYDTLTSDFCRFIGSRSLTDIRHLDIREYLAFLGRRGLASSSLDLKLHGLRAFFDFLTLRGEVPTNPARFTKTRRRHRKLPQCPTIEEVRRLIEAAESPRDRAVLETFYATGCRLAEVSGMRCEDVDFEASTIRVLGKGNKERVVLFGRMAKEALLAYVGDRREGFLFQGQRRPQKLRVTRGKPKKHESGVWFRGFWREYPEGSDPGVEHWKWLGRTSAMTRKEAAAKLLAIVGGVNRERPKIDLPLHTRTLGKIVQRAARRAGIAGIHPHSFRHAFATHLLNRGVDLRSLQELLGHTSVSTTQIYTHVAVDQLSETHKKFHPRG